MRAPNLDPMTYTPPGKSEPLVKLSTWISENYRGSSEAPGMVTVRRWAREGLIQPPPEKHGRSFYVVPSARYTPRSS